MGEVILTKYGESSKPDLKNAVVTLASGTLTYDGTPKMRAVASVVVNGQTLVENTDYTVVNNAYTNAGDYTMMLTGIGNYKGTKSVNWSIAKAQGSLSINSDSLVMASTAGTTGTVSITKTGDGTISASSGSSGVATASVSGTTVTVTAVSAGIATITVTMAEGTNYLGASDTFEVGCISSTLAENSPAAIQMVAEADAGSTYWSVGARTSEISIAALPNMAATSACAFILGFNHNSSKEGNGIHFQLGKTTSGTDIAFVDSGYGAYKTSDTWFNMNNSQTTSGGWAGSRMKTTICPAFYNALPIDWKNAISPCTKYTDNTGGGSNTASYVTATTDDKIWLLSEYEVFGTRTYANSAEQNYQKQYTYYANSNSKIKNKHNATTTACIWWFRSTYATSPIFFCCANESGNDDYFHAHSPYGFAPGFRIA